MNATLSSRGDAVFGLTPAILGSFCLDAYSLVIDRAFQHRRIKRNCRYVAVRWVYVSRRENATVR